MILNSDNNKYRVMVVDDDEDISSFVATALSDIAPMEIEAFNTEKSALAAIPTFKPQVVVTDMRMEHPESGIHILEATKAALPDCVVILVTGFGKKEVIIKCLQRGAFDFIEKPIQFPILSKSVSNALDHISLASELESAKALSSESRHLAEIGLMAGTVFHEVRNPLAIIRGYADKMKKLVDRGQPEKIKTRATSLVAW